jgi:hypothetical protein
LDISLMVGSLSTQIVYQEISFRASYPCCIACSSRS